MAAHGAVGQVHSRHVESQRVESGLAFLLTGEEQAALMRVLRVVEDEWWLDEVERALLERLESSNGSSIRTAA